MKSTRTTRIIHTALESYPLLKSAGLVVTNIKVIDPDSENPKVMLDVTRAADDVEITLAFWICTNFAYPPSAYAVKLKSYPDWTVRGSIQEILAHITVSPR